MPTTVLFWNVQRLGGGSQADKSEVIKAVLAHAIENHGVELCLLCEVTSAFSFEGAAFQKQLAVRKRKAAHAQLAYAAFTHDLTEIDLEEQPIDNYTDNFPHPINYHGGNQFSSQSKRKVAYVGAYNGIDLLMYHANSSYKAATIVDWIAEDLSSSTTPFVIVGDFNCEPAELLTKLLQAANFNVRYDLNKKTHNIKSPSGPTKTLDYAIGWNAVPSVTVLDIADFFKAAGYDEMPDHAPIVVTF